MARDPIKRALVSGDAVEAFARKLEKFAAKLTDREYRILCALVEQALPPLDRMRTRNPADVLTEPERAVLDRLKGGRKG